MYVRLFCLLLWFFSRTAQSGHSMSADLCLCVFRDPGADEPDISGDSEAGSDG